MIHIIDDIYQALFFFLLEDPSNYEIYGETDTPTYHVTKDFEYRFCRAPRIKYALYTIEHGTKLRKAPAANRLHIRTYYFWANNTLALEIGLHRLPAYSSNASRGTFYIVCEPSTSISHNTLYYLQRSSLRLIIFSVTPDLHRWDCSILIG